MKNITLSMKNQKNYRLFDGICIRPNGDIFLFSKFSVDKISIKFGNKYAIFEETPSTAYDLYKLIKFPPLSEQILKVAQGQLVFKFKEFSDTPAGSIHTLPQAFFTNTKFLEVIENQFLPIFQDGEISIDTDNHIENNEYHAIGLNQVDHNKPLTQEEC